MKFSQTTLPGSYIVDTEPISDERGWFERFYCKEEFATIGHYKEWVQLNHSVTAKKGTVRGMHFQLKPFKEIKMVKCIKGTIFDVIVDLRQGSETFLNWVGVELSAENRRMLYIPEGFSHGFQCLTNDCELIYHHSEIYQPGFESGIRYNDPLISIDWPLSISIISERDNNHPYLDKNFKGI